MRYVPLAGWLKANSLWVSLLTVLPLAIISLTLTACVKHPIGDPGASKVDERSRVSGSDNRKTNVS